MRWELLENGELMKAALNHGFQAMLTVDKNIQHRQNLARLPLAVVVIDCVSNALPSLLPFAPFLLNLLSEELGTGLYRVAPDGSVTRAASAPEP